VLAFRAQALTRDGALAAFVVGTCTYASGGWAFTLVLLAFFIPSVALSRVGRRRKKQLVDNGKGGARDAWQVLANGGIATACALIAGSGGTTWIAAFAGSYAAATADTWGTEIGTLARGTPRSILTWQPIPAGLSGGVTLAGTAAEFAGAAWIAVAAALSLTPALRLIGPVCIGGIAGALVDSVLGATLQELRRCPACGRTCETNPHACGTPTLRIRGLRGFSNDGVNFAATLTGAAVAFALCALEP
jgi:uncharacterized protein (TIGR00297 family)